MGATSSGAGLCFVGDSTFDFLLDHSIVATNSVCFFVGRDIFRSPNASVNVHYSIIGSNTGSGLVETLPGVPDANGNLIGGPVHGVIDPLLGPLVDNGGSTFTHALLPNSPAINAGNPAAMAGVVGVPAHDQRGARCHVRVWGAGTAHGAVESLPSLYLPGDFNADGVVSAGDYTLWRNSLGSVVPPGVDADGDGDSVIDTLDYAVWKSNFGATVEELGAGSGEQGVDVAQAKPPAEPGG